MVAGHLSEKKGYYYAVLSYTDLLGYRKNKWLATGYTVKGNKKRAEDFLMEARKKFEPEYSKEVNEGILFADFLEKWLSIAKNSIAIPTYASYSSMVNKIICPYFRAKNITLQKLRPLDIQDFYQKELERVCANSVIHYHVVIYKALKYAAKIELLDTNPADKIDRPKKDKFVGNFYDADAYHNAVFPSQPK